MSKPKIKEDETTDNKKDQNQPSESENEPKEEQKYSSHSSDYIVSDLYNINGSFSKDKYEKAKEEETKTPEQLEKERVEIEIENKRR